MKILIPILLILGAGNTGTQAQTAVGSVGIDGRFLKSVCHEYPVTLQCNYVLMSWMTGWRDALILAHAPDQYFCTKTTTTADEIALSVMRFLDHHPGKLNDPASTLILEALSGKYPCPQEQGGGGSYAGK